MKHLIQMSSYLKFLISLLCLVWPFQEAATGNSFICFPFLSLSPKVADIFSASIVSVSVLGTGRGRREAFPFDSDVRDLNLWSAPVQHQWE